MTVHDQRAVPDAHRRLCCMPYVAGSAGQDILDMSKCSTDVDKASFRNRWSTRSVARCRSRAALCSYAVAITALHAFTVLCSFAVVNACTSS